MNDKLLLLKGSRFMVQVPEVMYIFKKLKKSQLFENLNDAHIIEYRSDDVTKIIFLKLWDIMSYSYRGS